MFLDREGCSGFPDLVDVGVVGHNQRLKHWRFEPASDAPLELLASITTRPPAGHRHGHPPTLSRTGVPIRPPTGCLVGRGLSAAVKGTPRS